jgi:hypothetical protein
MPVEGVLPESMPAIGRRKVHAAADVGRRRINFNDRGLRNRRVVLSKRTSAGRLGVAQDALD